MSKSTDNLPDFKTAHEIVSKGNHLVKQDLWPHNIAEENPSGLEKFTQTNEIQTTEERTSIRQKITDRLKDIKEDATKRNETLQNDKQIEQNDKQIKIWYEQLNVLNVEKPHIYEKLKDDAIEPLSILHTQKWRGLGQILVSVGSLCILLFTLLFNVPDILKGGNSDNYISNIAKNLKDYLSEDWKWSKYISIITHIAFFGIGCFFMWFYIPSNQEVAVYLLLYILYYTGTINLQMFSLISQYLPSGIKQKDIIKDADKFKEILDNDMNDSKIEGKELTNRDLIKIIMKEVSDLKNNKLDKIITGDDSTLSPSNSTADEVQTTNNTPADSSSLTK
tara:strand:- start:936 stop:1940 length:1005 start_codon:yes stop_codon:yes gene_type:complete